MPDLTIIQDLAMTDQIAGWKMQDLTKTDQITEILFSKFQAVSTQDCHVG